MQDDLFGRHGANTTDGYRLHRLFDVLIDFDVSNLLFRFKQQNFLVGQLQTRLIGNHMPATECLVVAVIAVQCHADIHFAGVQLLGRLGEGRLYGTQHHVTLDVFLTGNCLYQHQKFAIHAMTLLNKLFNET